MLGRIEAPTAERAIVLRDGTTLDTLREARAYIIALPEAINCVTLGRKQPSY